MQRIALVPAIIVLMVAGCAQPGSPPQEKSYPVRETDSQQPAESESHRSASRLNRNDLIVLLPKPGGIIGGVIVKTEGAPDLLLNEGYAGAHIDAFGKMQPVKYNADRTNREFSSVLDALPARPATFMLFFREGKDQLTADSEREVGRVFAEISARPYPEVLVIGHTDAVGNAAFNDQLSRQRAQRVRDDLAMRGIPATCIEVSGRGKREPLIPTSAEGIAEPRNRRVEINVR